MNVRQIRLADAQRLGHEILRDGGHQAVDRGARRLVADQADTSGMAFHIGRIEFAVDQQGADGGAVGVEVLQQLVIHRVEADRQPVGPGLTEQHPQQSAAVAMAFAQRGFDAAQIGHRGVFLVEQVIDGGHDLMIAQRLGQPLGDVVFLAHQHDQLAVAAQRAFAFPETGGEAAAHATALRQEGEQLPPVARNRKFSAPGRPERIETVLQLHRFGRYLAGEQKVLRQQQVMVIVVEGRGHSVVREHQEGQRARVDLHPWNKVAHEGLEERLVRNPGGGEKAHHVAAGGAEREDLFDGRPAQAPPLRADHDVHPRGRGAFQPQFPLQGQRGVEKPFVHPFVEVMAVDQPIFLHPRLDPVGGEEIETFDMIHVARVEEFMRVFGGFDRAAIAGNHVEMGGAGEGLDRRFDGVQGGADQRPFPPAAFHPPPGHHHVRIVAQAGLHCVEGAGRGGCVEMDRDAIARRRQPRCLRDDGNRVLVTQQDEGDLRHGPVC